MLHPIENKNIFIVLPVFNEGTVLQKVVTTLLPYHYSIVIVDDGSAVSQLDFLSVGPVHFLRHRVNLGQGAALHTGIEYALSQNAIYIVTFDADGQHQANDVPRLIDKISSDRYDIIFGSRFLEGSENNMTRRRKLLIQAARFINFLFTGLLLTDAHNGMRIMNHHAASTLDIKENGMAHATEILTIIKRKKLRYTEAPVQILYTDHSRKKGQNLWDAFRIFFDLLLNKLFG